METDTPQLQVCSHNLRSYQCYNNCHSDRHTECSSIIECRRNVSTSSDDARKSLVGPVARVLLHHFGIHEEHIKASGPHNVLMKSDVLEYIKEKKLQPGANAPSSPSAPTRKGVPFVRKEKFNDIELSNMRRTIAKRLTQSKTTIPHSYMTAECCVGNILKLRKRMEKDKIKVSVNDFVIKAAAVALKRVAEVNVMIDESTNVIKKLPNVDISIAVATKSGLITPIIKDANKLSVVQINENVKQLANKAR
ncbi:pyruvate dehydrogenase protein X component-like protein, partial [Leptotrombidium deliense]